jgi:hypothetical protein
MRNTVSIDLVSTTEGVSLDVLEPDDGSGWVKVSDGQGSGLVPATYLEIVEEDSCESRVERLEVGK